MRSLKVDVPVLKGAYERDPKVRAIFEVLLDRKRGRQDTTLPRIRRVVKEQADLELSREEAEDIMQLWQKAGCGTFIPAENDQDVRFLWDVSIPSVMEEVIGRPSAMTLMSVELNKKKGKKATKGKKAKGIAPAPVTRVRLPKIQDMNVEGKIKAMRVPQDMPEEAAPVKDEATETVLRAIKLKFKGIELTIPFGMTKQERAELDEIIINLKKLT